MNTNIIKNITRKVSKVFAAVIVFLAPAIAFAQTGITNVGSSPLSQTSNLNDIVKKAIGLFNSAIYLIVALAILTFVWNVYRYFVVKDPENKKEAGNYVMFSIVGIFVILSLWGLVNIISNTLNINTSPGTLNVSNLIGNITGGSSGTTGSSGSGALNFNSSSNPGSNSPGITNPNSNDSNLDNPDCWDISGNYTCGDTSSPNP